MRILDTVHARFSHPHSSSTGAGFIYLSRVKNERLNIGHYPSDALIHQLANALDTDDEEILILAKRISGQVWRAASMVSGPLWRILD